MRVSLGPITSSGRTRIHRRSQSVPRRRQMRMRWHQAYALSGGTGGFGRDGIGTSVTSTGCVGSYSGGSWLSGRRSGCGIASPWPGHLPRGASRSILTRVLLCSSQRGQIRQQNYSPSRRVLSSPRQVRGTRGLSIPILRTVEQHRSELARGANSDNARPAAQAPGRCASMISTNLSQPSAMVTQASRSRPSGRLAALSRHSLARCLYRSESQLSGIKNLYFLTFPGLLVSAAPGIRSNRNVRRTKPRTALLVGDGRPRTARESSALPADCRIGERRGGGGFARTGGGLRFLG
jgi:hypothetical protein